MHTVKIRKGGNPMENALPAKDRRRGLNRNQLKYLAILAMTLDHIAWAFVDPRNPLLGGILHVFGRLTAPTMTYFLAEGYSYTRNPGKYQLRLAIFALLSWLPFVYFEIGRLPIFWYGEQLRFFYAQGVIFTLFLGLSAIRLWDSKRFSMPVKLIGIFLLCLISNIGDWMYMIVLGCLAVHIFRDRPRLKWAAFTLSFLLPILALIAEQGFANSWYQLGVVLSPLLLYFCYNGESGSKTPIHKWFFYWYYPVHLVILGILRWVIGL